MKESKLQEIHFIEYLESCKKLIIKVSRIYCKDPEDRKDLIQDIILQLWRSYPKYDKAYAISTWTYRIALNVSISFLRKAKTRNSIYTSYQQQAEYFHIDDTVTDSNLEQLYNFIELLKPIDKALMILQLEGCKNKEISSVMGMSDTNISTRKQRIKDKLKLYFETYKQQYNEI
ncbi:MAG TPA: sigma-70 family RNA polymerase sigma factor [Chitinophagaceae bacterium]|nr:sigma-70 family RNA polymerase sigma factor [Chitinophagaceae bacterium]